MEFLQTISGIQLLLIPLMLVGGILFVVLLRPAFTSGNPPFASLSPWIKALLIPAAAMILGLVAIVFLVPRSFLDSYPLAGIF